MCFKRPALEKNIHTYSRGQEHITYQRATHTCSTHNPMRCIERNNLSRQNTENSRNVSIGQIATYIQPCLYLVHTYLLQVINRDRLVFSPACARPIDTKLLDQSQFQAAQYEPEQNQISSTKALSVALFLKNHDITFSWSAVL